MAPELVAEFIREFQREARKDRSEALAARAGLEKRLGQLRKEIANIVTAITQGMFHPSTKDEMDRLEAERAELEARLAAQPAPDPVAPHPGLADIYHRKVAASAEALNDPEDKAEAAGLLRGLIEKMVPIRRRRTTRSNSSGKWKSPQQSYGLQAINGGCGGAVPEILAFASG